MKVFEKIGKAAVDTWKWLNEKKTAIGFLGVQFCALGFAKNHIPAETLEIMNWTFTAIGGVGVVHKVQKSDARKKVIENIKKAVKK